MKENKKLKKEMQFKKSKAVSAVITGVLVFALCIMVVFLVFRFADPYLAKLKDTKEFENAKKSLEKIDLAMNDLQEKTLTQKGLYLEFEQGKFLVDQSNDLVQFEFDSQANLFDSNYYSIKGNFFVWNKERLTTGLDFNAFDLVTDNAKNLELGPGKYVLILDLNNSSKVNGKTVVRYRVELQ